METLTAPAAFKGPRRKLRLLPLVAATYFMVSGGPYGLEDIIGMAGYGRALLILCLVPLFWSLPTSLMVGELASAMPCEGGFYIWVQRALGRFWGFQEAWLSLAASVFDMAIYPTTFVLYLSQVAPTLTSGHRGHIIEVAIVLIATLWNLGGAVAVGEGTWKMMCVTLSPFVVLIFIALWKTLHGGIHVAAGDHPIQHSVAAAIPIALWNYMGWDNASTIAQEVEHPQRNYPRAMLTASFVVLCIYTIPLSMMWAVGIPASRFSTGAWADAATVLAGPTLGIIIVLTSAIDGLGTFTALTLTLTRLPSALAQDGLLPRILTLRLRNGVPWVSVVACAIGWALALGLTFERLISIDLVLYGSSLILEFIALVVLRIREPSLERPFRIPGGTGVACLLGLGPTLLIAFAMYTARDEQLAGMPALLFALLVGVAGALFYLLAGRRRPTSS